MYRTCSRCRKCSCVCYAIPVGSLHLLAYKRKKLLNIHTRAMSWVVAGQGTPMLSHSRTLSQLRCCSSKTTTMLFKMLGIERAWSKVGSDGVKPRQLFVTQSRILAEKVQEYFLKLLQSLATGSYSLRELAEMAKMKKDAQGEAMLIDHDDDVNWREDLPQRFSQLEDKHFPLFVNFERVSYCCRFRGLF